MFLGSDIDSRSKAKVAGILQEALYDLSALSALSKQARWNVVGPIFHALHFHLELMGSLLDRQIDEIAGAIVAIGFPPSGQSAEIASHARIKPIPSGFLMDDQVICLIADRVHAFLLLNRDRQDDLQDIDILTWDMLRRCSRAIEKQMWNLPTATHRVA